MRFRTRFAPSPSGHLHLGHAYSAACAWHWAAKTGGECLLRLEDIDTTRCKPEFAQSILDDLAWLSFAWPKPVRVQSAHFDAYSDTLSALTGLGLTYRCFKTRRDILDEIARAPHGPGEGPDGQIYRGPLDPMSADEEAERLARGESHAWRLSINHCRDLLGDDFDRLGFEVMGEGWRAAQADALGDVILGRRDIGTSYHIAVVHDDALQEITHIVRGVDLEEVTGLHVLLQRLLGLNTPVYRFHPLITDETGKRLAKRDRAATLKSLREAGLSPADVHARLQAASTTG